MDRGTTPRHIAKNFAKIIKFFFGAYLLAIHLSCKKLQTRQACLRNLVHKINYEFKVLYLCLCALRNLQSEAACGTKGNFSRLCYSCISSSKKARETGSQKMILDDRGRSQPARWWLTYIHRANYLVIRARKLWLIRVTNHNYPCYLAW